MDTSRTINSQSDRLSRHTRRIEQLLGRSKSKSKSPYRCHTPKISKQGPMVARFDTYLKYQYSFIVLNKIIQFKVKQLMSDFVILLKYPQKREVKVRPSTKFVVIKEPAPKTKSNMIIFRISNLFKAHVATTFSVMKQRTLENKIKIEGQEYQRKSKMNIYNTKVKAFVLSINLVFKKSLKAKKATAINTIARIKQKKQKISYPICKILELMLKNFKRFAWEQMIQNKNYKNSKKQHLRSLACKLIDNLKHKLIRIGQSYSKIQSHKPRQQDIDYIKSLQYLQLNYLSTVLSKAVKFQLLSSFQKLLENNSRKLQQQALNNRSFRSTSSTKSIKNRYFPKLCNKFIRFAEIFKTKQMKIYDEIFQMLFENRFDSEQFYFNNQVLERLILSRAFKQINQNTAYLKRQENILSHLPKLIKILKSKIKILKCNTFWSMHSNSLQIGYEQMEPPLHKCPHGLSYIFNKIVRSRLIEGYLSIKRSSNQFSNIPPVIDDTSSIMIYDDMASFLEERQGAFEQLKNNYDKLKAMVGFEGQSEITSTSYESIRAIHQIKSTLMTKSHK